MPLYKTIVKKVSIPQDKKVKQKNYEEVGQLAVVDQGKDIIGGYSNDFDKRIECDLPVVIFGDHTCTVKYINFPFAAGADGIKILESKDNVVPKYLYYGTKYLTLRFPEKGYARHYQHIEKMDLFLPTVSEQRRIVFRIEELFSKLDKGVETLQTTKQQLAVYRQTVLTAAFPSITSCNRRKLSDIAIISSGITKGRKLHPDETIKLPYLRVANVQNGFLDLTEVKEIDLKESEKEKFLLKYGDVLYTEGGDRDKLGRGTIWRDEIPNCVHQNHIFKARVDKSQAIPQYVAWWSMSSHARDYFFEKGKQTVNLASINKTVLANLELPLPSLQEQEKITEIISSRFSSCDSIERTVDRALAQTDAMRQSILKRAFEGTL